MGSIFGGGSKPKNQTTSTEVKPYKAAEPGLNQFYGDALKAYQGGNLNLAPYPGQSVAPVSPETAQYWQGTSDRAMAGSPLNAAAGQYVQSRLDPNYLTSDSPGLQSVLDRSRQGVNSEFSRAGRTFSGAHAGALGSGEGQIRYQDFARKSAEQANAAGMAPNLAAQDYFDLSKLGQVGTERQGQLQDLINSEINRFNALQGGKANELSLFQSLLNGGGSGGSSTTAPMPRDNSNPWLQGIGTAASLASLFMGNS
jgi:hypothetical protein